MSSPSFARTARCCLSVLTLGWSLTAVAGDKADPEAGFQPLFPNQTLDGWTGSLDGWKFEDGVLICTEQGGAIQSAKEYGNFVFRFEYLLRPGGNNGVNIRGMEIQILDDDAPKHAHLKPCQYNGSIYCTVPAKREHNRPVGQWNEEEIRVEGQHVVVTLNGAVIVDAETDHNALKKPKGFLGFKGHHEHVEFRNLRIRELP